MRSWTVDINARLSLPGRSHHPLSAAAATDLATDPPSSRAKAATRRANATKSDTTITSPLKKTGIDEYYVEGGTGSLGQLIVGGQVDGWKGGGEGRKVRGVVCGGLEMV